MKKTILIIAFLLSLLSMNSCYKDLGNYEYGNLPRLSIEYVEETYPNLIAMESRLMIIPEVSSVGDYQCVWMLMPQGISHPEIDTISMEKELNWLVDKGAGSYLLVLEVTDLETDDVAYVTSDLTVSTQYLNGWYILKEVDEATDLDRYSSEDFTPSPDLFLNLLEHRMPGIPQDLSFIPTYRYIDTTDVLQMNRKTLWVCSDEEVYMLDAEEMQLVYDHANMFYTEPEVEIPQCVRYGYLCNSYFYLSNRGLYWFSSTTPNTGKFGTTLSAIDGYELSPWSCTDANSWANIYFDKANERLLALSSGNLITFSNEGRNGATAVYPANTMNCDLLYMGQTATNGYAVIHDKTNNLNRVLELDCNSYLSNEYYNPITHNSTAVLDEDFNNATLFALNYDLPYFYYSDGESIHIYDNMSQQHYKNVVSVPSGESITFMQHIYWKTSPNTEVSDEFDYFVVATNHGDEYTIYFYNLEANRPTSLAMDPITGKGKVKDIYFINSAMSQFTPLQSYPINQ